MLAQVARACRDFRVDEETGHESINQSINQSDVGYSSWLSFDWLVYALIEWLYEFACFKWRHSKPINQSTDHLNGWTKYEFSSLHTTMCSEETKI